MGIVINIEQASGRASCKSCKKKINKGIDVICFSGLHSNYFFHQSCIKDILKNLPKIGPARKKTYLFSGGAQFSKIEIWINAATGKAKCPICDKTIKNGLDIVVKLYDGTSHYHPVCIEKRLNKIEEHNLLPAAQ